MYEDNMFKIKFAVFSFVCILMRVPLFENREISDLFYDKHKRKEYAPFINNEILTRQDYEDKILAMFLISNGGLALMGKIVLFSIFS